VQDLVGGISRAKTILQHDCKYFYKPLKLSKRIIGQFQYAAMHIARPIFVRPHCHLTVMGQEN